MMKYFLSVILCLAYYCSLAQTNTIYLDIKKPKDQLEASSSETDWKSVLNSLNATARSFIGTQNNDAIIENILPLFKKYENRFERFKGNFSDLNYFIGLAYTNLGQYERAIPFCETAHEVLEKQDAVDEIKLMIRKIILSHLYYSTNQIRKALKINEEGLDLAEKSGNLNYQFRFLMNGGNAYQAKGEFDQASSYFERAYEIISKINPNPLFLQAVKTNLGSVYISANNYKAAKKALVEALEIARGTSGNKATGEIYDQLSTYILFNDLTEVYSNLNQPDSALYWSYRTIEGIERLFPEGHAYTGEFLLTKGRALANSSKYDSAKKTLNLSIQLNDKYLGASNALSAEGYIELGKLAQQEQKYAQAHQFFQNALSALISDYQPSVNNLPDSSSSSISPRSLIATLDEVAKTYGAQFQKNKDQVYLERGLETYNVLSSFIEKFKADLNSINSRLLFSSSFKEIYERAITTAYHLYHLDEKSEYMLLALNWMEKNKGNELFIALNKSLLRQDLQDSLLELENDLKSEITFLNEKVHKINDSTITKNLENSIFELQNRLQSVIAQIKKKYPKFYQIKYGNRLLTWETINGLIFEDLSITSYFLGHEYAYFIKLDDDGRLFEQIKGGSRLIKADINQLNVELKNRSSNFYDLSYKVYEYLKPSINFEKNLVFLPDGILNALNFDYLLTTAPTSGDMNYLIEKTKVSYAPSLNYLLQTSRQAKKLGYSDLAVYAPKFSNDPKLLAEVVERSSTDINELTSLPNAQKEAKQIAELYSTDPNWGEAATETKFKSDNSTIIHLATHAILDPKNSLNSKLLLEKDSLNDGFVHLYEIYNLQLSANLVSLSACNTGIGKYYEGEGTMSLAHGFMYAGVPNVMMSLWSVPDKSTSEIMQGFYKYLKDGYDKPAALRQAKLDYLANADQNTAHPYFWAGFVFIGNVEADNSFFEDYWLPLSGLAVSLFLFGLFYYRKKRA